MSIKVLHTFMKQSPLLLSKFFPPAETVDKLQVPKLIKSEYKDAHLVAVEFSSFLIANCRVVLPIKLVGHDIECYSIIQRHNELEQWTVMSQHQKMVKEMKKQMKKLEQSVEKKMDKSRVESLLANITTELTSKLASASNTQAQPLEKKKTGLGGLFNRSNSNSPEKQKSTVSNSPFANEEIARVMKQASTINDKEDKIEEMRLRFDKKYDNMMDTITKLQGQSKQLDGINQYLRFMQDSRNTELNWKEKVDKDIAHVNQLFKSIKTRVEAHFVTMVRVDKKLESQITEVALATSPRFDGESNAGQSPFNSKGRNSIEERLSKIEDLHKLMAWNTERELILNESYKRNARDIETRLAPIEGKMKDINNQLSKFIELTLTSKQETPILL